MPSPPSPPSRSTDEARIAADAVDKIDDQLSDLKNLEDLADKLLRQVTEREVELDMQAEKHADELRGLGITSADRTWKAAPWWVRVATITSILLGLMLMR